MYTNLQRTTSWPVSVEGHAIGTQQGVSNRSGHHAGQVNRDTKLAYCAGLFDGDGAVLISRQQLPGRKNRTYRLTLSVVQNCYRTLARFRDVIGQQHCLVEIRRTKQHNRQIYDIRYDGRHAVAALQLMLPHLVRKKIEAEVAIDFWTDARMGVYPGPKGLPPEVWETRDRFFRKMRDLK